MITVSLGNHHNHHSVMSKNKIGINKKNVKNLKLKSKKNFDSLALIFVRSIKLMILCLKFKPRSSV